MKIFLLSLFVAAAFAAPAPLDEDVGEPVELIVNGLAEGEPLELGDVLGINVKEHIDGEIASSTNLLYPLTAAGLAEAAAADIPDPIEIVSLPEIVEIKPEEIKPEPIVLPSPSIPAVIPSEPISLPAPMPESIIIAAPSVPVLEVGAPPMQIPGIVPEVVEELPAEEEVPVEDIPVPAPQFPNGEILNDGVVQVIVNKPEPGVLTTVQSWFNMVLNYFNGDVQTSHQIV